MESSKNKKLSKDKLKIVKNLSTDAFSKIGSENYKQKLAYTLLNIVKSNNQKDFFWTLLRALNSQKDNAKAKELVKELKDIYPISSGDFEKLAYSVIMGIMSAKSETGGD
ncbi:MAG: hypothetical protein J7K83_02635 [Candidatus Aenigmarchaeota archaeon]|nr:hypothetical protein [Candidatus Aenigmarchaeota archaeon]